MRKIVLNVTDENGVLLDRAEYDRDDFVKEQQSALGALWILEQIAVGD